MGKDSKANEEASCEIPASAILDFEDLPWNALEGAYERCLHEVRIPYMRAFCRDVADNIAQGKMQRKKLWKDFSRPMGVRRNDRIFLCQRSN
jgi:hypothetical protein